MYGNIRVWGVRTGEIDVCIYGHFIEHLGRGIYGGCSMKLRPIPIGRVFAKM